MQVATVLQGQQVVTVDVEQTLGEVANRMRDSGVTGVPVVDAEGHLVGLVTTAAIMEQVRACGDPVGDLPQDPGWSPAQRITHHEGRWRQVAVRNVMMTDLVRVHATDDIRQAAREMARLCVHRAVVLDDGDHVTGVLSPLDFLRYVASLPE